MAVQSREQKLIIAYNLTRLREEKFGGRGYGKVCAEKLGVPQPQWSAWESGSRALPEARRAEVAKFFGVTPEDLVKEPENWPEIRAEMAARRRPRPGKDIQEKTTNEEALPANSGEWVVNGQENFSNIVALLANGMKRAASGEIDSRDYDEKMRQILQYVKFTIASG